MQETKYTIKDYGTKEKPSWCPGCGDFTILNSLKGAFAELQLPPENICLVAGIGCGSLMPYWVNTYGMCTLHGRAIPVAKGVKVANRDLTVVVNCGDGDGLGIGLGHYAHTLRRNLDMTIMLDNNGVYGLTKGQTAPTANKGTFTSSTPFGSLEQPVNGLALALTMGATFVARTFAGDQKGLTQILAEAIKHKGTAVVDILQPCVTFNKVETYEFYLPRVENLNNSHSGLDPESSTLGASEKMSNKEDPENNTEINSEQGSGGQIIFTREEAYAAVTKIQDKIPVGIFYREEAPTYEEQCFQMEKGALVNHDIENVDPSGMMERFA